MTQSELDAVWPGWTLVRKLGQGSYGGVFEIQRELPGGNLERSVFKKISIPRSPDEAYLLLAKSISEQSITAHYQKQMEKLVQQSRKKPPLPAVQQKKRCQQPPKRKVQPLCCCRMLTALTRLRRMA